MDNFAAVALIILLLTLVGAALIAFVGPYLPRVAPAIIANATLIAGFLMTGILALTDWQATASGRAMPAHFTFGTWAAIPPLKISFGLLIDPLAITWMLIITGVGFLIHLYSVGYMASDRNYRTFFAYMNLFVFTM